MKNKKQIPIFFSCDDNYLPYLAVAIQSLEDNASKNFNYRIIVLHSNSINKLNMEKIIKRYSNDNFIIEFADITTLIKEMSESLHTRDYYSKSTYYRLFIPELYPQFDKAIYLDSDIVVLGDISKLYLFDIGDNLVGATADQIVQKQDEFVDYVERRIGVSSAKEYFNAGVLVMNLEAMRLFNFEEKFFKLLLSVKFSVAQDQDYLNVLCKNKVAYFDPSWNQMPLLNKKDDKDNEINLIHFNLDLKPWKKSGIMFEDYFWHYAKKTDFYKQIKKAKSKIKLKMIQQSQKQTENLLYQAKIEAQDECENVLIERIANEIIYSEMFVLEKMGRRVWKNLAIDSKF